MASLILLPFAFNCDAERCNASPMSPEVTAKLFGYLHMSSLLLIQFSYELL
nr:MAG TPA: hypothetical protein [Caudoviricetes sp.]